MEKESWEDYRWKKHQLRKEALEVFRTAISYRFVSWLNQNRDVFIADRASFGSIFV